MKVPAASNCGAGKSIRAGYGGSKGGAAATEVTSTAPTRTARTVVVQENRVIASPLLFSSKATTSPSKTNRPGEPNGAPTECKAGTVAQAAQCDLLRPCSA